MVGDQLEGTVAGKASMIRAAVWAWIAYDFINSLLIINGSLYFSRWITMDQKVNSFWYGFTYSVSTLLLFIATPIVGAAIDRRQNGQRVLFYSSVAMGTVALCLTGMGHKNEAIFRIIGTLIAFGLINFFYQLSLVPYNWLLPQLEGVEAGEPVRRYTAIGEGAGSLGSVAGALIGVAILTRLGNNPSRPIDLIAIMAGVFLLLFGFDYFFLRRGLTIAVAAQSREPGAFWAVLLTYFRDNIEMLRSSKKLRRFLLAFLIYADALLTVQLYLPIYLRERLGLSDTATSIAFAVALVAAGIGAFIFAKVGTVGALPRVIVFSLAGWIAVFIALGFAPRGAVFWTVMVVSGLLFGVLWSASRAYLYQVAARETFGKGFGLFSIFERCASVIGPLVWGVIMLVPASLNSRYFFAFTAMGVLVLTSILLIIFWGRDPQSQDAPPH
ncbi:MAG: MFS transporter [Thermoanaerobaculia bacterium]